MQLSLNVKEKTGVRLNRSYVWLLLFSCACIYLIFASFSFRKPVVADEVGWMTACTNLGFLEVAHNYWDASGQKFRLLYTHPVALIFRVLGVSGESARLLGILSFGLTLILVYGIATEVFKEHTNKQIVGLIACLLYVTHPMGIQGSLILGEDNTILTPMTYLFFIYFLKSRKSPGLQNIILLGILLNLVLWVKPTPLPFLVFTIAIFCIIDRGFKKGVYEVSAISIIGVGLYLVLWWIYSEAKDLPFLLPFSNLTAHIGYQHISGTFSDSIAQLALRAARLIIWVSPLFILLGIIATTARIKEFWREKRLSSIDVLLIYFWSVFIGYLLIGGITFGFPRYHFPMLPALSIIVAYFIFQIRARIDRKGIVIYSILILFLVVYNVIVVGDLVYGINYKLKESLIDDAISTRTALLKFTLQSLLYSIPLIVVFFITRVFAKGYSLLKVLTLSLFVCTITANLSLNIIQARAEYNTGYEYGGTGTRDVIDFLVRNVKPNSIILATEGIVYNYNNVTRSNSPYFTPPDWEKESFIRILEEREPAAVVYGISSNTEKQFREVFKSQEVQRLLQSNFEQRQIGSYTVWLRKD